MPNRVDGAAGGVRPTPAGANEVAQRPPADQTPEARTAQPAETPFGDRVEISNDARDRAEAERPRVGETLNEGSRGAALNAPGAQAGAQAGEQGSIEGVTADQADQVRTQQEAARREATREPAEQQGNLVDVVG